MDVLTRIVVWLNAAANVPGAWLLAPVGVMPGWLSATLVAAVTGVLLLAMFKYTSNQRAIKRVRDDIDANLLALKLFKENARVTVGAQGRLLVGAGRLFVHALVPMAVMLVPVTLILGQLSLWYQQRPLLVGEDAVVTVALNGDRDTAFPEVRMEPTTAVAVILGPVRVLSKREVCWHIEAQTNGYHRLTFTVDGQPIDKELAVGDGFMRVSARRPAWDLSEALMHPAESAFAADGPVRSIEISYPSRSSWISGSDWWVLYWFVVSMIAAFCFRRALGVNVYARLRVSGCTWRAANPQAETAGKRRYHQPVAARFQRAGIANRHVGNVPPQGGDTAAK